VSTPVRLAVLLVCGVLALGASEPLNTQAHPGGTLPLDLGPEDAAYRDLFTPASSPPGTFTVYRSAEDIRALAARLRSFDATPAPGAWDVDRTGVFDAFGAEPPYDKGRLARLFGGSSPWVARGSLATPRGRIAVALISPYPDLAITTLRQGTLVIVTRLRAQSSGGRGFHSQGGHRVQRGPVSLTKSVQVQEELTLVGCSPCDPLSLISLISL
jgi:hypothetical protein